MSKIDYLGDGSITCNVLRSVRDSTCAVDGGREIPRTFHEEPHIGASNMNTFLESATKRARFELP